MKNQNNPLDLKCPRAFAWTGHRRLRMYVPEEKLEDFFRRFDTNKDHRLSKHELKDAFDSLDARFPAWRAKRALRHADADGNGYISEQEMQGLVKYAVKHGYDKK